MTQQTINVGASANDGTGDTLRAAMQKTNANFAEVYAGQATEALQDMVASFLAAGQNVTLNYNDAGNSLTIAAGVKNNYSATIAPSVNDDSSSGYADGSRWTWKATGESWVCRDATAAGAKWVKVGVPTHPGYVAGNWYYPFPGTVVAGSNMSANTLKLFPWLVQERCTVGALGARVTTLHAGGNFQLGIYSSDSATKQPTGNVLASTSNLTTAATGEVSGTLSIQLEPGLYWIAFNTDDAVVVFQAPSGSVVYHGYLIGGSAGTPPNIFSGNTTAQSYLTAGAVGSVSLGTWPDLTSVTCSDATTTQNCLYPRVKISSVP